MKNLFIKECTMGAGSSFTENGAVSYASTGNEFVNQFAKCGGARHRPIETVWNEQAILWSINPLLSLKFAFYLRMITRQSNLGKGAKTEKVQRGQGSKDEAFKRLLWVAKYHPDAFYNNAYLLGIIGCFKDYWKLMEMGEGFLDNQKIFNVIAEAIVDSTTKDLVKKYLPRIRSTKSCKTDWAKKTNELAKNFCKYVGWTYKEYRQFKSTGKAHEFQRLICKGLYSKIKWNTIPGKALLTLVSGKFLEKHNLTKNYLDWLDKQPLAKFNGYAYELGNKLDRYNISLAQKNTIDKQFKSLVETASKDGGALKGNILCALDTSGSMTCRINNNTNISAFEVCVSLGILFSEMNTGAFHDVVAMFDNTSKLKTLHGTFSEKWAQITNDETAWGGTNFQSLIDLLCETRKKKPSIPISDFPETLLVISDMQFNCTGNEKSNFEMAKAKLLKVFPAEYVNKFKIVWWYCTGRRTNDFPSTIDNAGTYFFSGFDGAIISFLLGGEDNSKDSPSETKSMIDLLNEAMNQEALSLVKL